MEKLKVINLAKSYDRDVPVLRDISFCVDDRDFFVILGPSGCGKTTLLNIIAGVEDINGGEIYIDGIRVNENKPQKRDVAMVFQNYALYPTMNVFDNIAFPLRNRHFKKKEIEGKVLSVAKLLHIEDILKKRITQISGGQKQRVAIGRAIVREPKLFLFDEPLSNLDATLRSEMRQELLNLHSQLNSTFIYVTHRCCDIENRIVEEIKNKKEPQFNRKDKISYLMKKRKIVEKDCLYQCKFAIY